MKRIYILYDGRAENGSTDDALVYCTANTLKEARTDKKEMFPDAVIYSYKDEGNHLTDERRENEQ